MIILHHLNSRTVHISNVRTRLQGSWNPNPAMQLLYFSIVDAQSFWGSLALLNNMHSSLNAFSSLHTQHGLGFVACSAAFCSTFEFPPRAGIAIDDEAIS